MKNPKRYWKIGRHPKEDVFKTCFQKLKLQHQWVLHHELNDGFCYAKDPTRIYNHKVCKECKEGMFLFGIADDGVGNKGVEVMIFLDYKKNILHPIFCRTVKITDVK